MPTLMPCFAKSVTQQQRARRHERHKVRRSPRHRGGSPADRGTAQSSEDGTKDSRSTRHRPLGGRLRGCRPLQGRNLLLHNRSHVRHALEVRMVGHRVHAPREPDLTHRSRPRTRRQGLHTYQPLAPAHHFRERTAILRDRYGCDQRPRLSQPRAPGSRSGRREKVAHVANAHILLLFRRVRRPPLPPW